MLFKFACVVQAAQTVNVLKPVYLLLFTSAKEVIFYRAFVCLSVCLPDSTFTSK